MERLGIEKVHEAGQGCQAVDRPHKDAVTVARTAIPGSTSMAVQKLEKHKWRRHGPRHITQTAVTQTLQPQETDGHCACANAYSISRPDGPPRHGSGGFAPGFIVSHYQEKWKWTAGPDTREPGRRSQVKKSDFQVQVRATQPAPSLTTPQRTLQYTEEVKGAEQTSIVGGEFQRLRLDA
jgi:hypothetical protein